MTFKYEAGQVLVADPYSHPLFVLVEKRTAYFLNLVPLLSQVVSDPTKEDFLHCTYLISTPTAEVDTNCGHHDRFRAGRYKIVIDQNGSESNNYGLELWDGKPLPYTFINGD